MLPPGEVGEGKNRSPHSHLSEQSPLATPRIAMIMKALKETVGARGNMRHTSQTSANEMVRSDLSPMSHLPLIH